MRTERSSQFVTMVSMLRPVVNTFLVVLLVSGLLDSQTSAENQNSVGSLNREKRNVDSNQMPHSNEQLMTLLQEYDSNSVDVNFLRYAPTPPSPDNVNCYVEVPVTTRVGGRCVRLGGSTWGCQAGIFLAFSSECQSEVSSATPSDSDTTPSSPTTRSRPLANSRRPRTQRRQPTRR